MAVLGKRESRRLWEIAFSSALGAFLKPVTPDDDCKAARKTAIEFANAAVEDVINDRLSKYTAILREYSGLDALERIMQMDGWTEYGLNEVIGCYYADKSEPLRCYAGNYRERPSNGMVAIARFLEGRGEPPVKRQIVKPVPQPEQKSQEPPVSLAAELRRMIAARAAENNAA